MNSKSGAPGTRPPDFANGKLTGSPRWKGYGLQLIRYAGPARAPLSPSSCSTPNPGMPGWEYTSIEGSPPRYSSVATTSIGSSAAYRSLGERILNSNVPSVVESLTPPSTALGPPAR